MDIQSRKKAFEATKAIFTTTFQAARNSPVFYLRSLPVSELEAMISEIKEERRQCDSALHWLEGIIKVKEQENDND